ncbi:hypothetical protein VTJ49DRAFT_7272 [Mycothermus thermophilus]|uniref:pyridoxal kinase n=1 Tax=Humicola insolens TaxID=85995 RepID=A0ABR3VIQ6_HUMIN
MSDSPVVPETRVLAVASHVVSGYVGNKIAVFSLQSLGCDVAALNTVQFSNHTGYRQWTGSRVSAEEIIELYRGLKQSYLDDFDMMLSGYVPGAAALEAVGRIGEELKRKAAAQGKPGSFFWVLDPVMGDNGNLYVAPDVVPVYKSLVPHADLVLPNQFEAELLSETPITSMSSIGHAIQVLHERYGTPHVVITSVSLPHPDHPVSSLSVVGSSMTSDRRARPFKIVFPAIDCYFSGTGDMFAALIDDDVDALDLPLARAAEKVLATMHEVLTKTAERMQETVEKARVELAKAEVDGTERASNVEDEKKRMHLLKSKAAELRLVRHLDSLRFPKAEFRATRL